MSGGEGFGPVGPSAAEAAPFSVTGPAQLRLGASRTGTASFTVSNTTGRPVRARLIVQPGAGADASWFAVAGESERALPVAGTATVDVTVTVPEKTAAGTASFTLGAALEEAPDRAVSGPNVAFDIPAAARRRFPWWIVIVVVAVLLLAGGGLLIWNLTRSGAPEPTSSPSPTPAGPPVFASGEFTAEPNTYFDLDTGTVIAVSGSGEDVYFYPGGGSGELGVVGQGPPRLAVVDEPTFADCEAATDYDDINAQNVVLLPDRETYVCVRFTDQQRRAVMTIGPAEGTGLHVAFTTWERD
ncbi:hypothetical protein ACH3VR_13525 [Microbacterium sp. B2969]|uniref:BACON domain-containing protein n=1 Tax=Microbacterium alkaliflavum TaxID=3248839 RepID=A0ABW7QAA3_9MICO